MLELNKLYNMDCMDGMKQFPDKYFELAIVDPPYGINIEEKNNSNTYKSDKSATISKDYGGGKWDSEIPNESYFIELFRVSKNQIIWGVNYYNYCFFKGGRIYWDKCVTMPTYSKGEIAYCSLFNSVQQVKIAWHGMIQQDMKNKEDRIHPTQKPVALYAWLLNNYAKKGDKILDTHVGSASSLIACHKLGFQYVGFELDTDYFKSATERLEAVKSQISIFDEPEPTEKWEQLKFI